MRASHEGARSMPGAGFPLQFPRPARGPAGCREYRLGRGRGGGSPDEDRGDRRHSAASSSWPMATPRPPHLHRETNRHGRRSGMFVSARAPHSHPDRLRYAGVRGDLSGGRNGRLALVRQYAARWDGCSICTGRPALGATLAKSTRYKREKS